MANKNRSMHKFKQVIITNEYHSKIKNEKERTDKPYREIIEDALDLYFCYADLANRK